MPRSKFDFEDAAEAAPEEQDARWGGHYDALGISHGASVDDVRTAYSLRVLQAHPDKGGQLRVEDQAEGERQACQDAAARSSQKQSEAARNCQKQEEGLARARRASPIWCPPPTERKFWVRATSSTASACARRTR